VGGDGGGECVKNCCSGDARVGADVEGESGVVIKPGDDFDVASCGEFVVGEI